MDSTVRPPGAGRLRSERVSLVSALRDRLPAERVVTDELRRLTRGVARMRMRRVEQPDLRDRAQRGNRHPLRSIAYLLDECSRDEHSLIH